MEKEMNPDERAHERSVRDEAPLIREIKKEDARKEEARREEAKKRAAKKKSKKIRRRIFNTVITVLAVFILFEGIVGIINVENLKNGKSPILCFGTSQNNEEGKKVTIYHMGLYIIKQIDGVSEKRIELKPFFFY